MMEISDGAVNLLKEAPYQHDIGRAGDQKPDGKSKLHPLAGCMDHRSHGRKHPAILGGESRGFFFAEFISRLRLRLSQKVRSGPILAAAIPRPQPRPLLAR